MIDVGSTKCAIVQRNIPLFILIRDLFMKSSFVGTKSDKKNKEINNNNSVLYSWIMQWKESFA